MLSFGQRLKLLRREADISQSDLADSLGVSAQSVSKWECDLYFPDVSMLLPLANILGVTTDCLLGAGSNEKEDREALIKEIIAIKEGPWSGGRDGNSYRIYSLIDEFLKKYPLNYEMKIECANWIELYLFCGRVRHGYEIPDNEFEELWAKGFKMLNSVKNQDNDPTRLCQARIIMIGYYNLKDEYDKAEIVASELPEYPMTQKQALYRIANERNDFEMSEKISKELAVMSYYDCVHDMWQRARRISVFGQVRKDEAITAWYDALTTAREFDRLFANEWPFGDADDLIRGYCLNHPKIIASNIYFGLIGDLLAIEKLDEALGFVEELTVLGEEYFTELKGKLASGKIDEKTFEREVSMIKDFPLHSYNSVIQDDDNILTREDRYKACKARLDALE